MFKPGDRLQWRNPTDDESTERLTVVEDRGDRVLVTSSHSDPHARIAPTFVCAASDLRMAPRCNMCGADSDSDGNCAERCDDDRCTDCELSDCDGTGEECSCNFECHDAAQGE